MKKNYVKPELDVVIFAPEQMLASSDGNGGHVGVLPGEGDEFSNKRNPSWNSNNWE